MTNAIYTVGNGQRTQFAMRHDGMWFMRTRFNNQWGKWLQHGRTRPYDCGVYLAPGAGKARLPDEPV